MIKSAGPAISIIICMFLRVTVYFILLYRHKINFIKTYIILIIIMAASFLIDLFLLKYSGVFIFLILAFATRIVKISDIKNMIKMLKKNGK